MQGFRKPRNYTGHRNVRSTWLDSVARARRGRRPVVERFPDLGGQCFQREGLLQEVAVQRSGSAEVRLPWRVPASEGTAAESYGRVVASLRELSAFVDGRNRSLSGADRKSCEPVSALPLPGTSSPPPAQKILATCGQELLQNRGVIFLTGQQQTPHGSGSVLAQLSGPHHNLGKLR